MRVCFRLNFSGNLSSLSPRALEMVENGFWRDMPSRINKGDDVCFTFDFLKNKLDSPSKAEVQEYIENHFTETNFEVSHVSWMEDEFGVYQIVSMEGVKPMDFISAQN